MAVIVPPLLACGTPVRRSSSQSMEGPTHALKPYFILSSCQLCGLKRSLGVVAISHGILWLMRPRVGRCVNASGGG